MFDNYFFIKINQIFSRLLYTEWILLITNKNNFMLARELRRETMWEGYSAYMPHLNEHLPQNILEGIIWIRIIFLTSHTIRLPVQASRQMQIILRAE